jgi:ABC-2 type transport system ATP-binding protein
MTPAIEARSLVKRYGTRRAVDELSFAVAEGRVTGFVGPNGAGKTSTMRMILGLAEPDGGDALVRGRSYRSIPSPLTEVGALLDAGDVHPGRSARAHLLALAQSNGLGRRRVDQVLEVVGIGDVARARVGGFSLGMRQRLGIAAALLGDPPVLLFDEPINGLDPEGIRWFRDLARELAGEGRAVFVSSHLMSEMEYTADQVIVIGQGRLIVDDSVESLLRDAAGKRVVVRTPQPIDMARVITGAGGVVTELPDEALSVTGLESIDIGDLAAIHGLRLSELRPERRSLEEAFMSLTKDAQDFTAGSREEAAA